MKRWIRTIPGKVTLFLVTLLSLALLGGCVAGALVMVESDFYTTPKEEFLQDTLYPKVEEKARWLVGMAAFHHEIENELYETSADETCLRYGVYTQSKELVAQTEGMDFRDGVPNAEYVFQLQVDADPGTGFPFVTEDGEVGTLIDIGLEPSYASMSDEELETAKTEQMQTYIFYGYLEEGAAQDDLNLFIQLVNFLYTLRYGIFIIGAAAALLALVCFITLLCVSGRRPDTEELAPGPLHRVPIDLLLAFGLGACLIGAYVTFGGYPVATIALIVLVTAELIAAAAVCLGLAMSVACRIKTHTLLKNTVIWRACKLCWKLCKLIGCGCKKLWCGFLRAARKLPMIWRTCLIVAAICFLELLFMAGCYTMEDFLAFWTIEHLILVPVILFGALTLRRLQAGGEALANGDLSYQVDTHGMYWDFKRHGENLNSIAEGMTRAVEQRLKSERMKTELITNVSHDIKTPLTSIINYADLIGKESCDNPKIGEYAEVLGRQSGRLKRLIEDLVEASKASTGNLEVLLAPCEAENFLVQISGEFSQKLSDAGLELITTVPEQSLRVMADGRRMLRVFDNLMNNICKYAQRGTRVYLTLEEREGMAQITFRNTSSAPLNLTPEELMERFVRGDSARSSDGNGLGLSIARSLTELQKGSFQLDVDGDLFKVTLRFPLLPNA